MSLSGHPAGALTLLNETEIKPLLTPHQYRSVLPPICMHERVLIYFLPGEPSPFHLVTWGTMRVCIVALPVMIVAAPFATIAVVTLPPQPPYLPHALSPLSRYLIHAPQIGSQPPVPFTESFVLAGSRSGSYVAQITSHSLNSPSLITRLQPFCCCAFCQHASPPPPAPTLTPSTALFFSSLLLPQVCHTFFFILALVVFGPWGFILKAV